MDNRLCKWYPMDVRRRVLTHRSYLYPHNLIFGALPLEGRPLFVCWEPAPHPFCRLARRNTQMPAAHASPSAAGAGSFRQRRGGPKKPSPGAPPRYYTPNTNKAQPLGPRSVLYLPLFLELRLLLLFLADLHLQRHHGKCGVAGKTHDQHFCEQTNFFLPSHRDLLGLRAPCLSSVSTPCRQQGPHPVAHCGCSVIF